MHSFSEQILRELALYNDNNNDKLMGTLLHFHFFHHSPQIHSIFGMGTCAIQIDTLLSYENLTDHFDLPI